MDLKNMTMDDLLPIDYIMVIMFAWIISQSIIVADLFWLGVGIWFFQVYARKRGGWQDE